MQSTTFTISTISLVPLNTHAQREKERERGREREKETTCMGMMRGWWGERVSARAGDAEHTHWHTKVRKREFHSSSANSKTPSLLIVSMSPRPNVLVDVYEASCAASHCSWFVISTLKALVHALHNIDNAIRAMEGILLKKSGTPTVTVYIMSIETGFEAETKLR